MQFRAPRIFISIVAISLTGITGCSNLIDPPKYEYGDCITPTDLTYSWYGEYAKVEALVIKSKGNAGRSYVLWFPEYKSDNSLFMKEIELDTKKVDYLQHCGLPR